MTQIDGHPDDQPILVMLRAPLGPTVTTWLVTQAEELRAQDPHPEPLHVYMELLAVTHLLHAARAAHVDSSTPPS